MAYLLRCEEKETNFFQQRSLRIAHVTIYRAYFKRDPNAFHNAERQLMEAWATQEELIEKYAPHFLPAAWAGNLMRKGIFWSDLAVSGHRGTSFQKGELAAGDWLCALENLAA